VAPDTIGDDVPIPARRAFHAMFSLALHFTGSADSGDTPALEGPRHCGQSDEAASGTASRNGARTSRRAWQ
jgi:hypothetical protein